MKRQQKSRPKKQNSSPHNGKVVIDDDRRWTILFERSKATLSKLAKEALAEFHAGRTHPFDPSYKRNPIQ